MDQETLRYIVAAIVLALGVWMFVFSRRLRKEGVEPASVAEPGTNIVQRVLLAGALVLDLYLMLRAPVPALDGLVAARPSPSPVASIVVLVAGALVIFTSQLGMRRSWRVGVPKDRAHIDELVTGGAHRFSRNPVYLGIMVFLGGAALAAPGPLTIGAVIASFCGLTLIIRQEEHYLRERFGPEYDAYAGRVRRWI